MPPGVIADNRRAAVALAPVQGRVGVPVEEVLLGRRGGVGGHADRQRERGDRLTGDAATHRAGKHPACNDQPVLDRRLRQEDREFVAADAECPVGSAHVGQRQASNCHEQRVARGVAALVVDALEVVDVDNEQAQRCAEPFRVDELASQLLLECAVVAELREAVEEGVRPSASVHLEQVGVLLFERLDTTDDRCGHQREHERQRQRHEGQQQDDEHARARSVGPQAQDREHADEHDELQHDQGDNSSPDREAPLGQRGRFH